MSVAPSLCLWDEEGRRVLLSRRRVHRASARDDLTDHDGLALVSEARSPRHAIADGIDIPEVEARSSSEKGLDSTRMELLSSEVTCPREDDGEGRLTEAVWYGDISGIGSLDPEELG